LEGLGVAERSRWSPVALTEWALVAFLAKVLGWLPESAAYALGEWAGRLAFRLDRRHRAVTVENLTRAFPGAYSPAEIEALARSVFENLGRTAVDVARFDRLPTRWNRDALRVEGCEGLREARQRGKGVLLLGAHFGPWELLPLIVAIWHEPFLIVARPLDNPWLDDLFTALRERGGNRVVRKRDAVKAIQEVLRRGETVGILIDQHISEKEGVVVPFFGRPASTVFAPALIAMRSGAAVVPFGITREGRGRYHVWFAEEVPVRRTGNFRADLVENTARFTAAIETRIRQRPEQWFWVHRRWKTRLPLDPRLETGNWKLEGGEPLSSFHGSPSGRMADMDPEAIGRILVRQVNWVGDAVLTLPALEALDRRFPQAEITLLAKSWVSGLFAGQPGVDRIIEYRPEAAHKGLLGRWRLAAQLRKENFDLAVVFPNSLDAALVPCLARIPRRLGYPTDGRRWLLTHPIGGRSTLPGRHQVERYLDIVRALGGDGGAALRLRVSPEAQQAAERLLADHGIGPDDLAVAVNPGSVYGSAKRWPAERFAAVADRLADRTGARVLLIGSERETSILEQVAAAMRGPAVNLGGRTNLRTLVGILARAGLLLSNDTGAMHIAAAVGTPVVAIFGPTDAEATGPLGTRSRIVREPVPCSPCLLRECPIDHRCLTRVSVDQVLHAAMELLEVGRGTLLSPPPLGSAARGGVGSPAAFLDRDGTIIQDRGYLGDPEGIRFIPGAVEALRALQQAGFRLILVTNQAGVARGMITEADVRRVNERLQTELAAAGVRLEGMYSCPHHPEHGPPEYRRDCDCRKPRPGMIHQAIRDFDLDPTRSVVIGDHVTDVALAQAFPGMRGIMVLTGHGAEEWQKIETGTLARPEHVASDVRAAAEWFLARLEERVATVASIRP
jgi:heptosyltransferase-2